jgi:hypothetical protein
LSWVDRDEIRAQFQKAFGCRIGDAIVRPPADRCEVW